MPEIHCIGICTGGGDAPGLNAVIRAAVKAAILKYKWKVIGIPDGFDGLIYPERSHELTLKDVSGILPRGGTILGTTNRGNPFKYKTVENGREVVVDVAPLVVENARRLGLDAVHRRAHADTPSTCSRSGWYSVQRTQWPGFTSRSGTSTSQLGALGAGQRG